jgi:hypothetical protein
MQLAELRMIEGVSNRNEGIYLFRNKALSMKTRGS